MKTKKILSYSQGLALGALILSSGSVGAADWPGYRGLGDGVSAEQMLAQWPSGGPRQIWRAETPNGFSSFTVSGGKACVMVTQPVNGTYNDVCLCFDAATGRQLWAAPLGPVKHKGGDAGTPENRGGDGARSTPALSGKHVYIYSADMVLLCLNADTGKVEWKHDVFAEHQGVRITWDSAMSPVVDGNLVFVAGGGSGQAMLAFNKETGALVWKSGSDKMTHSTPVVATLGGVRQIIFFMQSGLVSLNAETGAPLWSFAHPFKTATAISPVVCGDIVFCSAGYGVGGAACQVVKNGDALQVKPLWSSSGVSSPVGVLWSTPVYKDGYIYGMLSSKQFGKGPLKCVDIKTGKVQWEKPGFGSGQIIAVGNHLLALSDDGQLALVEPNPKAYQEIVRAKVVDGKCWSTPSFSDGHVFIRSTKESVCLDLSAK